MSDTTVIVKKKRPTVHYVDNAKLYACMVDYKTKVKESEQNSTPKPRVPEYVGESIWKIAEHLSTKGQFCNYPFREEMVGDGVENCLVYIDNFNTEKYNNPFAYFTQIVYYAFLRRITKEKKQLYVKHKMYQNASVNGMLSQFQEGDDDQQSGTGGGSLESDYMDNLVIDFENKLKEKKAKNKKAKTTDDDDE